MSKILFLLLVIILMLGWFLSNEGCENSNQKRIALVGGLE